MLIVSASERMGTSSALAHHRAGLLTKYRLKMDELWELYSKL